MLEKSTKVMFCKGCDAVHWCTMIISWCAVGKCRVLSKIMKIIHLHMDESYASETLRCARSGAALHTRPVTRTSYRHATWSLICLLNRRNLILSLKLKFYPFAKKLLRLWLAKKPIRKSKKYLPRQIRSHVALMIFLATLNQF